MRHLLPRSFRSLQNALSSLLGCDPAARPRIIAGMLRRSPAEATGYWLQLLVSVGIASLGLVLGSTAVVIGAMLIAPLMGPIVNFGMGLAIGSPFLVLRSGARIVASVIVAVTSSAVLTSLLPFHELNAELAARTTPTALDLFIAGFCALAGVYASMRPGSDVASTAAGTSIGISLVPPLCASGYGLGTATWSVAGGAALLFLTNFVAIIVVGTICFAAAGFHQVNVRELEAEDMAAGNGGAPIARAIAGQLERVFASRSGPWLRLLMPLLLLLIVYLPLREALDEVAWQIKARRLVQTAVQNLSARVVQSRIRIERGDVDLGLVLLGSTADANKVKKELERELGGMLSITPRLDVLAVPDAKAFAGLEAALRDPAPITVTRPPASTQLEDARSLVQKAVERHWPRRSAGAPLAVSLTTSGDGPQISVVHVGNALDPASREVLDAVFQSEFGTRAQLVDSAIPPTVIPGEDTVRFIGYLAPLVERSKQLDSVWVCVHYPPPAPSKPAASPARGGASDDDANLRLLSAVRELFDGHPRTKFEESDSWSLRFVVGGCPIAENKPE